MCLSGGAAGAAGWASTAAGAAVARRNTPLHRAAYYGHADVAAALIGAGADMTVKNIDGYAALRCAEWPTATAAARLPAGGRQSNSGLHLRRHFLNFMGTFLEVLDQSLKPHMWIGPQNHYQYRQFKKHDVMKGSPHTRRPWRRCAWPLVSPSLQRAHLLEHDVPDLPLLSAHSVLLC